MKTKTAIYSHLRPHVQYASAGENVQVIAWHGEVAVVADIHGNRFSVPKECLVNDEEEINFIQEPIPNKRVITRKIKTPAKREPARALVPSLFEF